MASRREHRISVPRRDKRFGIAGIASFFDGLRVGKITDKLVIYQSASSVQKVLTCALSELILGASTIHIFDCQLPILELHGLSNRENRLESPCERNGGD